MLEFNRLAVTQRDEVVPILRMMTVQTPDAHASVVELHIAVYQQVLAAFEIDGKIPLRSVASTARGNGFWDGLCGDGKLPPSLRNGFI
jgi:hypothetical protein